MTIIVVKVIDLVREDFGFPICDSVIMRTAIVI